MSVTLKSVREIEKMRAAGQIVAEAHELMREHVQPGVTTAELNDVAHRHITQSGGVPSFLGYPGHPPAPPFPGSICASVNDEIVHGIPGERELKEGDIIAIDIGVIFDGYHGDAARTLPVGEVSDESARLIRATEGSFWAGMQFARASYRLGDLGAAIQMYAESKGFAVLREYVGHGIGRSMHEAPQVPNYGEPNTGRRLRAGMTLAVEPMLNVGSAGTKQLDDGWTVVTEDGKNSAHYENTVLITEDEPIILTLLETGVL
jgi:methionyl aminopeptidase